MTAPSYLPIDICAVIVIFISAGLLVAVVLSWLGKKEPVSERELRRRKVKAVALGSIIVSMSLVVEVYKYPYSGVCLHCGHDLDLSVANSSSDFTMDDFQVSVNYTWDRYLAVERWGEHVFIRGIDYSGTYWINIISNRTPVFWGKTNLTLTAYPSNTALILTYVNSTGASILFELESTYEDGSATNHFAYGHDWVDIRGYASRTV